MINIEEAKKKYLIPSGMKIAICNADEIKEMVLLLESQKKELEIMNLELFEARKAIRELTNKSRIKTYLSLESKNLEFAQKLHAANQEIERLLVVEKAYAAYKKAY